MADLNMITDVDADISMSTIPECGSNKKSLVIKFESEYEVNPTIEQEGWATPITIRTLTDRRADENLRSGLVRQGGSTTMNEMLHAIAISEAEEKKSFRLSMNGRFNLFFFVLPTIVSLLFAVAIMFPAGAREKASFFLWTDGALTKNDEGKLSICPRESICSDGGLQILLIFLSRATAFASYIVMGATFLSKMHCFTSWLTFTHASMIIPFEKLHKIHKKAATIYFILALLHVIGHFVRWSIRQEMMHRTNTQVGISGVISIFTMIVVVFSMSSFAKPIATFETRINAHYLMILFVGALSFHTTRCRHLTLIFFGLWSIDYLYGYFFKTHRLDIVEFSPLPDLAGVQMLWHNPKGFKVKSGEYVKIKLPWLSEGGSEWHAFSIYLREATEQGLTSVLSTKKEKGGRIYIGNCSRGGGEVNPKKTALLLVEIQNEFACHGGRLYNSVKSEMERTGMVENTVRLAAAARRTGAQVFHLPLIFDEGGYDNPNQSLGILKEVQDKSLFVRNTWNAKIINQHKPQASDTVVKGKKGLDSFPESNLQELLQQKGIETVIIGGFLTNCGVESTMRTAYEKGFNVITLTDGSACKSKAEHLAATEGTFKMFSTPMTCEQVTAVLEGNIPLSHDNQVAMRRMSIASVYEPECVSLQEFIRLVLLREEEENHVLLESSLANEEARRSMAFQYETTQVFIAPSGDWTKRVAEEVSGQDQLRSCWVRGPYTSPYSIAPSFNHLVLVASGIGITPALGVMGQFQGSTRTKFLLWSTRSPEMLKFFAPLMKDAHVAAIFYTGKDYVFTQAELIALKSYGNIYIDQKRPDSLTKVIESFIVTFENQAESYRQSSRTGTIQSRLIVNQSISHIVNQSIIGDIDKERLKAWCVLYCGGSDKIQKDLRDYTRKIGVSFDYEKFDW